MLLALRIDEANERLVFVHDCIAQPMFQEVIYSDSPETTLSMFRFFKPSHYVLGQRYAIVRRSMRPIDLAAN